MLGYCKQSAMQKGLLAGRFLTDVTKAQRVMSYGCGGTDASTGVD